MCSLPPLLLRRGIATSVVLISRGASLKRVIVRRSMRHVASARLRFRSLVGVHQRRNVAVRRRIFRTVRKLRKVCIRVERRQFTARLNS